MAGFNGVMAGSPDGGGQSRESFFYDKFWICPRCGGVYSRAVMNGCYVCKHCWTDEDTKALEAKKEEIRQQLKKVQDEIEEYHKNKRQ